MRHFLPALGLALVLCLAPSAPAQELLLNGGFETGDFTSWTTTNLTGSSGVDSGFPHTGNFAAFFGEIGPTLGTISQSVTTDAGSNYLLTFWLHSGDNGPNHIQVMLDNTVVFDQVNRPDDGGTYAQISIPWIAAGPSTTVSFGFSDVPAFIDFDDASFVGVGVPEPTTWALMGVSGAAVVGGTWWRRYRARSKLRGYQPS